MEGFDYYSVKVFAHWDRPHGTVDLARIAESAKEEMADVLKIGPPVAIICEKPAFPPDPSQPVIQSWELRSNDPTFYRFMEQKGEQLVKFAVGR